MKLEHCKVIVSDHVLDELASPVHTHLEDRCINCEERKKIIATITLDKKSGPICVKCFKSYQE